MQLANAMFSYLMSLPPWAHVAIYFAIPVIVYFGLWFQEEIKILRLGGHAPIRKTKFPFGIDYVLSMIKHGQNDMSLQFWDHSFRKFGNPKNPHTVEVRVAGKRIITTVDPENIKAILATQFNDFGKGEHFNKVWHEFLGDSIFSTDHQKWHDSRQLIRPQFVKDRVSDLGIFEEHVTILMDQLYDGQPVDMKDLFFKFTLDAATHFLLGRSMDTLKGNNYEFAIAFAEVQRIQSMISRAGPLQWAIPRAELRRHLKVMNAIVEPYIDEALSLSQAELEKGSKSDDGYTFLHAIAAYTRDRKVLRDQLVAVLLAGRDTTACTLSWLFHQFGKHPEVVAELRKEIEDVVGLERQPTYTDLKNMRYLGACLNEVLRLYPVVPYNFRISLKDTSLPRGGGPDGNSPIGVPKGTPVPYSTHYMQLTPGIYPPTSEDFPDPIEFAPRRWLKWTPKSWTYIPFNGGPRICVGQQFALTEMGYTAVRILQRFSKIEDAINYPATDADHGLGDGFQSRGGATAAEDAGQGAFAAPSMPVRMSRNNIRMTSDIVLQPHGPITTVFRR